jgi:hypothetical protein
MGAIAKTITGAFAAGGLLAFSQLPEFAQQYSQRLGGAINELRVIVADFDRDAANSQLTRDEALEQMLGSPTKFARDRGVSMNRTINRYYMLNRQRDEMEQADPLLRPLFMLQTPDATLAGDAWSAFEPALPVTTPGAVYGGAGALLALIIARLLVGAGRGFGRACRGAVKRVRRTGTVGGVRVERAANACPPDAD